MAKTVIGLYDDPTSAQDAVRELVNAGIKRDQISLMANDAKGELSGQMEPIDPVEDLGDGAAKGAVLGGLGGLLVGLGALAIPGIGPILAAGPIAAALAGAGAGAVIGSVVGVLVDAGVSEDQAHAFAEGLRRGGTLVVAKTSDDEAQKTADVMNRYGAIDVEDRATGWRRDHAWHRFDEKAEPLTREQIEAERTKFKSPGTGRIATESPTGTVYDRTTGNLEREDLETHGTDLIGTGSSSGTTYQRDSLTSDVSSGAAEMIGGEIADEGMGHTGAMEHESAPDMEELRRKERFADEGKMRSQNEMDLPTTDSDPIGGRQEFHSDEIGRQTDMENPQSFRGSSEYAGGEMREGFETVEHGFRDHFDSTFSNRGYTYDQFRPAYEYGYDLSRDDRYSGQDWNAIENDARRDWERRYPQSGWEDFKDAVREGWQQVRRAF